MTHLWPTCWSFRFKSNVTWKIFNMEQGYWTSPLHRLPENKIFGHHMLQNNLIDIKCWFHTNDTYFTAFIRPKVFSCTHQISTLFSKEHVISGSHSDNLVCRWDPPDPPKKWPRLSGSSNPLSTLVWICASWTKMYKVGGISVIFIVEANQLLTLIIAWCQFKELSPAVLYIIIIWFNRRHSLFKGTVLHYTLHLIDLMFSSTN